MALSLFWLLPLTCRAVSIKNGNTDSILTQMTQVIMSQVGLGPEFMTEQEFADIKEVEMQAYYQELTENYSKDPQAITEYLNGEGIILNSMDQENSVEKKHWKYKSLPTKFNDTAPTVVFHGIR